MKTILRFATYTLLFTSLGHATVTLQFSTFGEQAGGFEDGTGSATDGMAFAVVVDTSGGTTGFSALDNLSSFNINSDRTIIAPDLVYTFDSTQSSPPSTTTAFGEVGSVTTIANILYTGFSSSDPFAIIWFPDGNANQGSSYGYLTDPGFVLPPDGNTQDLSGLAVFSGAGSFTPDFTIVPEPSSFALFAGIFGLTWAWAKRRR